MKRRNPLPLVARLLVVCLPKRLRLGYTEEIEEHFRWLLRTYRPQMGATRFWLFLARDFLSNAVSLRRPLLVRVLVGALAALALGGLPRAPIAPVLPRSVVVRIESSDATQPARFSLGSSGGDAFIRTASGLRALVASEEFTTPTELTFVGALQRARFSARIGSPALQLQADAPAARLRASGRRLTLYRDPGRIGVRTW